MSRVIFLGDSLTWGGYGGNYVEAVRKQVGNRHEIINAGVGGNTTINLLRRLGRDVLAQEPDQVLVMVGGNDVISFSQPDTRPYYRNGMNLANGFVTADEFEQTYREILLQLYIHDIQSFVALEPLEVNPTVDVAWHDYNDRVLAVVDELDVPYLNLPALLNPTHQPIPERPPLTTKYIVQIGERERNGWQDWYTAQAQHGYLYTFDGVHWTPDTATQVADHMIKFMSL